MFKAIFDSVCDCACSSSIMNDILCPDLEPGPFLQVLNLIYTGQTFVSSEKEYESILCILKDLQISLDVTDLIKLTHQTALTNQTGLTDLTTSKNSTLGISVRRNIFLAKSSRPSGTTISQGLSMTKDQAIGKVNFSDQVISLASICEQTELRADEEIIEIKDEPESEESQCSQPDVDYLICGLCGEQFTQLRTLKKHQLTSHKQVSLQGMKISLEEDSIVEEDDDDALEGTSHSKFESSSSFQRNKLTNLTYEELIAPVKIDGRRKFLCRICSSLFSSKGNLCLHYNCSHYKEPILRLNENNPDKCVSCNEIYGSIQSLVYHIGTGHRALEKIVANEDPRQMFFIAQSEMKPGKKQSIEEVPIKKETIYVGPLENAAKSNCQTGALFVNNVTYEEICFEDYATVEVDTFAPETTFSSYTKDQTFETEKLTDLSYEELISSTIINGKPEFKCKICAVSFSTKGNLCLHYNYSHYKEPILRLNQYNQERCISCNENYLNIQALVYHIGNGHRVLEKIVANEDPRTLFFNPPLDLKPGKRRSFETLFPTKTLLGKRPKL